ncbi:ATP-binding cassette domain-containing protein [bacterium]|nr:ATP-binding cassette domain-containing protein [bacterium]
MSDPQIAENGPQTAGSGTTTATSSQTAALSVRSLVKEFAGAAGTLSILLGVDLDLNRGDAVVVTGPSGSGKSTLLYIIGLLDQATSGDVTVLGQDISTLGEAQAAAFRNEHIGFIFQDHHLLPQCSVLENVLIPLLAGDGVSPADEERAKKLLERVGLADRITHRPAQLSGGERQRVAVCRALINQPELLLADEPTGNLDQATAESVGTLLLDLSCEENVALICVTHSLELAARFPRGLELRAGKLCQLSD